MSSYYKIKSGSIWGIIAVKFVQEVYKDLIFLLFVCLIWLASKSIQVIVNDVETRFSTIKDDAVHQVIEWKRNYFVTLDCIEEIDGFFGPVLVISFASIFLTTSFLSFRCLNGIFSVIDNKPSASLIRIGKNITMTSGLICVTQMMKKQVAALVKALEKRKFADETLGLKVVKKVITSFCKHCGT